MLFDRARWLQLAGVEPLRFDIHRNERTLNVHVDSPRLVLFEWLKQPGVLAKGEHGDLRFAHFEGGSAETVHRLV